MATDRMKIVITGASGFLGRHLVMRLKKSESYDVCALTSRPAELKAEIGGNNILYLHKNAIFEETVSKHLDSAIVVNCAYPRNSIGTDIADGLKYIQKVFEAAADHQAAAIINISSQSVYSQQRTTAAAEDTPVCLDNPYAVGKYAVELMLESICKRSITAYTSLRMASLIGPGFDQRIVNRFIKEALKTGKLTVARNRQRFGFFDVEDAVSGIEAMLGSDCGTWKSVYNLGRDGAVTLAEIAETIRDVLQTENGHPVEIEEICNDDKTSSEICSSSFRSAFHPPECHTLKETVRSIYRAAQSTSN